MENNRRSFFKGVAAFAAGVVGAKVASYVPKKEEPKEELMVSSAITVMHEGEEYHPLIVKKTRFDGLYEVPPITSSSFALGSGGTIQMVKPKIRKANV
jgi:hypothetical protein